MSLLTELTFLTLCKSEEEDYIRNLLKSVDYKKLEAEMIKDDYIDELFIPSENGCLSCYRFPSSLEFYVFKYDEIGEHDFYLITIAQIKSLIGSGFQTVDGLIVE